MKCFPKERCGRGCLVVKVPDSWPTCHAFEPSTAKDPPCEGTYMLELRRPPVGVVWKLGEGVPAEVLSSHLTMVQNYEIRRQ
ncbi:hypothetical protein TNCV_2068091 [Trichonephila clavipes]|uniref:Uncharacterized protein n=1 Tax=Trichonephila clavipes TaxID=2585209 RepID=A0A8X6W2P2_TRICX|nr:hypothetical protein TNCV_2068091 [Trichonephila clavipes]